MKDDTWAIELAGKLLAEFRVELERRKQRQLPPPSQPATPALASGTQAAIAPTVAQPTTARAAVAPTVQDPFARGSSLSTSDGRASVRIDKQIDSIGGVNTFAIQSDLKRVFAWAPGISTNSSLQRSRVERALRDKSPSPSWCWPEQSVLLNGVLGEGIVVGRVRAGFVPMQGVLSGSVAMTLRANVTMALQATNALIALHSAGWCLQIPTLRDLHVAPSSGEICFEGSERIVLGIDNNLIRNGPFELMAPETYGSGTVGALCDRHSLAVILFCALSCHLPFVGRLGKSHKNLNSDALRILCCEKPVFLFDPTDSSNAPLTLQEDPTGRCGAAAEKAWPMLPGDLRALFLQAFCSGLNNPDNRPAMSQWREALCRLRDCIYTCDRCGGENVYNLDRLRAASQLTCVACGHATALPARIRIGAWVIMLSNGGTILPHHVNPSLPIADAAPVARVVAHPTQPGVWGLQNESNDTWNAVLPNHESKAVPPGRRVSLMHGLLVHFGRVMGEVRMNQGDNS